MQGKDLSDLYLRSHQRAASTILIHNEEMAHSYIDILHSYLYEEECYGLLHILMNHFLQSLCSGMFVMSAAPSISFVISAPLTAIGRRPTAVSTEKRPPTSSGTTKVS